MTGPRPALRPSARHQALAPAWASLLVLAGSLACAPKEAAESTPGDATAQQGGSPGAGSGPGGEAEPAKRRSVPKDATHQGVRDPGPASAPASQPQQPVKRDPIVPTEEDPDPVKKIDVVPFNTMAKGTSTGPCASFITLRGSMCVQQGKAMSLDDKTRVAVLKLMSERTNWTETRPVYCWAPRHALVLFDKSGKDLGWFDLSLPCGKARAGDSNGALVTKEGYAFEQLTLKAWRELADLLKSAGVPVDEAAIEKEIKAAESSAWAREAKPGELPPLPVKSR